ncbi:MAG: MASE4 domain-containing protein, partial [Pseudomonadota bacterium]
MAAHVHPLIPVAGPAQSIRGLAMCAILIACTLALLPFAQIHLGLLPAFFPVYQTAVLGACLLTSYLLFGHFRATRLIPLLYLAAGYFYTACVLVMQFLSFKGLSFSGEPLLGGPQSAIWLWFFWHLAPATTILLATAKSFETCSRESVSRSVVQTGGWLLACVAGTAIVVFGFAHELPVMDVDGDFSRITQSGLAPALELLLAWALAGLWRASRFRNVLHIWLAVVLVALLCDNAITMVAGSRNTLGWYAGRMGALVAFSVLAVVY